MDELTMQRERIPERGHNAVLRIMKVLPITIPMPLRIEPKVSSGSRPAQAGVRVAVGGTIKAGGFGARLIYRRVERGTSLPIEEASIERIALLHDRSLAIQPRAFDRSQASPPPDLWIQYVTGKGSPIGAPARVGRCDQGPFDLSPELPVDLFVDAAVLRSDAFDIHPLLGLALSGDVAVRSGITARLTISGSDHAEYHPIGPNAAIDVPLIPANTVLRLPRRPLHAPLGRDSWIFLAFLDGTGHVMGGESLLGRAQPDLAMTQNGWDPMIQPSMGRAASAH